MRTPISGPATLNLKTLRARLLAWFRRHARQLPWRGTTNPYRVWVSEIMLQQTRVETVVLYYERFLAAFPTVRKLAAADEAQVLKLWEGLGYYRRARLLHQAARTVVRDGDGRLPESAAQWEKLPGVGRYTAAAIASIACGEPVAALEGNVKRVLARLAAVTECIDEAQTTARLWTLADELLSRRSPGNFNQALMELGATVCRPRQPLCSRCPVREQCRAVAAGLQKELPVRRRKQPVPHYEVVAALLERCEAWLLAQRPRDGMLGGLWELPGGKVASGETHADALVRQVRRKLGVEVAVGERLATIPHGYSHFTITLHVYRCRIVSGAPRCNTQEPLAWVTRDEVTRYALPTSTRKALAACDRRLEVARQREPD